MISSTIRTSGSPASARAMPMRWRWPPESLGGQPVGEGRVEPYVADEPPGTVRRLCPCRGRAEEAQRTADRVAHRAARVQRGVRVLEDQLYPATQGERPCFCAERARASDSRGSSCRRTGCAGRPAFRPASTCRFPTPHEREDLAAPDVEGQAGHTVERAEELIRETIERNGIVPETVHADRGTSMTSK